MQAVLQPTLAPEPVLTPATIKQAKAFGLAGICNTLLDFGLLNAGIFILGLPVVAANLISTAAALSLSFLLNSRWVFSGTTVSRARSSLLFFAVTITGLFVLQTFVIHIFTSVLTSPASVVLTVSQLLGFELSKDFVLANTAKAIATVCTLVWNFLLYKKFVFRA
jgi:putative flippase GtrA